MCWRSIRGTWIWIWLLNDSRVPALPVFLEVHIIHEAVLRWDALLGSDSSQKHCISSPQQRIPPQSSVTASPSKLLSTSQQGPLDKHISRKGELVTDCNPNHLSSDSSLAREITHREFNGGGEVGAERGQEWTWMWAAWELLRLGTNFHSGC